MNLAPLDLGIIVGFLVVWLGVGLLASRRAGRSATDFFLSGRRMPWWLLGGSMVATTFSTDTPLLVTNLVRESGVAGNWAWWAFLLTGMLTTFIYARLWRRVEVMTDVEFYEVRYSGKAAAFLRGFRSIYLALVFNVLVMAAVTLAATKIAAITMGWSPVFTIVVTGIPVLIYASVGGLTGVLWTDFLQFCVAMAGSLLAAYFLVNHPDVGGLSSLLAHEEVAKLTPLLPPLTENGALSAAFISLLAIPLAIQWWSVYYPGAEPGGGGYVAQRMFAAKDEANAQGATLLFNILHYAVRPWPWILVALASVVLFPSLDSIKAAFPNADPNLIKDDAAYPAALTLLPTGLYGLVIASLIAAYMSTLSTQINLGASYLTNDVYRRLINPEATERQLVGFGRLSTVVLVILGALVALTLDTAAGAFQLLLQIGAGTGLIFILRWFWMRINAVSEITALVVSFLVAIASTRIEMEGTHKIVLGVAVTTLAWIVATFATQPTDPKTADRFRARARPQSVRLGVGFLCVVLGCLTVYGALFAVGNLIYSNLVGAVASAVTAVAAGMLLARFWTQVDAEG